MNGQALLLSNYTNMFLQKSEENKVKNKRFPEKYNRILYLRTNCNRIRICKVVKGLNNFGLNNIRLVD